MLTAAVEAVEEVGYARLTVAQVIARARVSRKTFYDLFEDREDCFLAAFNQAVDQLSVLVTEAYERESSWREGCARACSRCCGSWTTSPVSPGSASSRRWRRARACSSAAPRS